MYKNVLNANQAKLAAKDAINIVASAVKQTLGPGGNPVIIQRNGQNPDGTPVGPLITKDGVTVAEHVSLREPALNTIAQAIMQVSQNTVKQGGDGTTTAMVLAEAIYNSGLKYIEQGANNIQLYNSLKAVKNDILNQINDIKVDITEEAVVNVARISSNGDEEVAQIVASALKAVGEDGYVDLQDGYSRETTLEQVEGAVYKRGFRNFSPQGALLVNDQSRNVCELTDVAVLIYADKLDNLNDFQEFLGRVWGYDDNAGVYNNVVPLLIVANDFSDDLKSRILQIRVQGKLPIAAIKSPADGSPNSRTEMLEDLAVMLGGQVSSRAILELKDVEDDHLGYAERIEIGAEETVLFGMGGESNAILNRLEELNKRLETEALDPWDADNIRIRKGKLSGGIAIIRVGGDSELEMREKKDRIEDALCAAKVAIQDGIVAGGGWTLWNIAQSMPDAPIANKILKEALQAPIKQIITNSGQNAEVVLSHMPEGMGYNAATHEYVNLLEAGIIDPAKVTKSALENAVSIAGLLLTTGGALVSDVDPKDGTANPLAMMGLG